MERGRKGISPKKILEDNQRRVEKKGKTEEERERRRGKREEIDGKTRKRKIKNNNFLEYCRFWRGKNKKYIENFDITDLIETWMKEKGWERMKKELSQVFSWICQYAVRDKKREGRMAELLQILEQG